MIAPSKHEQVVSNTLKRLAQELDDMADMPTLAMPVTPISIVSVREIQPAEATPPPISTVPAAPATDNLPRIVQYPPSHMAAKYRPSSIMAVLIEASYFTKIKTNQIPETIYLNEMALKQYSGEAERTLGSFDGTFHILAAYGWEERIILKLDKELGLTLPICHVLCVCRSRSGGIL